MKEAAIPAMTSLYIYIYMHHIHKQGKFRVPFLKK